MTEEKKYSVAEIDRMRTLVRHLIDAQSTHAVSRGCAVGQSYRQTDRIREIEERLRTYMLNGTDPDEIDAAVKAEAERLHKECSLLG